MKLKRYFVEENRQCGDDPIFELRDREQEQGMTLIAEFYPHGWANVRYEVAAIAARLNGEVIPSPTSFDNERLAHLERRVAKLERGVGAATPVSGAARDSVLPCAPKGGPYETR